MVDDTEETHRCYHQRENHHDQADNNDVGFIRKPVIGINEVETTVKTVESCFPVLPPSTNKTPKILA